MIRPKHEAVRQAKKSLDAQVARVAAAEEEVAQVRQKAVQLKESNGLTPAEQQLVMKLL